MRLINVSAFLKREELLRGRKRVDRRTQVLELRDDEITTYAILSHRWIKQEVTYDEMIELAKMEKDEQDEVRRREGYRKILDSCKQAKKDGYEWLWVDTCCIDKRSSAELSEAINSMYRWYEHSRVCYAYLHDVPGPSFPNVREHWTYPNSKGWPEWFSRGWTLQEMIAPSDVQFFNKDWQHIGDKRTLAPTLSHITRVPQHIRTDGLSSNRPCVAQIISWAANRITTRVEDRAYSLLGLLDVNMPMLYGEGKKAFHRLQLEIIRTSNDQSIFAWSFDGKGRIGSILADDPSSFRGCVQMELMDPDEFIRSLRDEIPEEELGLIDEDRFGVFPITNRGIQIWLFLRPLSGSCSVFEARLPCRRRPSHPPVAINLALWKTNYYRYFTWGGIIAERTLQFRQLYLRYQDTPHRDITFEADDNAITENGFTYCGAYPSSHTGNMFTLTSTDPLYVKIYSRADCCIAVGFGQCFGQDWIRPAYKELPSTSDGGSREHYTVSNYCMMLARGLEHARSMADVRSRGERYGRVWVKYTHFPESTWSMQTSCIMWESSKICGVRIDVFPYLGFRDRSDEWKCFDADRTNDPNRDMRGLMIRHGPTGMWERRYTLLVDGISMNFSSAPDGIINLGDYGHLAESGDFRHEGNIFTDLNSHTSEIDITPRQHNIRAKHGYNTASDYVMAHQYKDDIPVGTSVTLYKPLGLSLPSNHHFNSLLTSFSTRLTNRYLVTMVIQCATDPSSETPSQSPAGPCECESMYSELFHIQIHYWIIGSVPRLGTNRSNIKTPLCTIAKPLAWHRDDGAGSASME
ncbi:heterokaryon incompatibility protein-domain-containing protein [Scleroderma yunnanense]